MLNCTFSYGRSMQCFAAIGGVLKKSGILKRSTILSVVGAVAIMQSPALADTELVTPENAIETTRFMSKIQGGSPAVLSRSRERYAVALLTGDMEGDGNWLTVMVGETSSLEAAVPEVVTRVFGHSLGDSHSVFRSFLTLSNELYWIDDETIGFFWEDEEANIQFYSVDVDEKQLHQLTDHETSLHPMAIAAHPDGGILYTALPDDLEESEEEFEQMVHDGFAIHHEDAYSLMDGYPAGESFLDRGWGYQWYYKASGKPAVEIKIDWQKKTPSIPLFVSISTDGRQGLISNFPQEVPESWKAYRHFFFTPTIERALLGKLREFEVRQLSQLQVVDLETLEVRPLWGALTHYYAKAAWSRDSKRVLIGPAFLPPEEANDAGLEGRAVVEVDPRTGKFWYIPFELEVGNTIVGLRWISSSAVEVSTTDGAFSFQKKGGKWKSIESAEAGIEKSVHIQIEERADLNTPPTLVAVDTVTGEERTILDPNPSLTGKFKLGHVEKVEWTDVTGRVWAGELYYPADYEEGKRYPFVMQTHGGADTFSLYGYPESAGLATGSGVYIAQMLAGRNIGVLQVRDEQHTDGVAVLSQGEDAEGYMAGYDGAVKFLIDEGLADPDRIGLQGFSRTGWLAQYSLVNSSFVYASAIVADNIEGGYIENVLLEAGRMEAENGGGEWRRSVWGRRAEELAGEVGRIQCGAYLHPVIEDQAQCRIDGMDVE